MGDNGTILEAVDLRRSFGRTRAIDGVSLSLARGEVAAVIGPNGAGKTTLLYLLGGVLFPSSGHVQVFGMHRWKQNYEIRKRSTFLPAQPQFGACRTPWEYLRLVAGVYGLGREELEERGRRLCGQMSMLPYLAKSWESLSLGMLKKTGLIGAFLADAELRMLDEPFAGGIDPAAMEALREWIAAARARGETVVLSTQDLVHAQDLADRLLILQHGELKHSGVPSDLVRRAGVEPDEPRALYRAFLRLTDEGDGEAGE